jgi:hypothetical protein
VVRAGEYLEREGGRIVSEERACRMRGHVLGEHMPVIDEEVHVAGPVRGI